MSVKKLLRFPQKGVFGQLPQYDSLLTSGSCPGFVLTCCQYDIMPAVRKANFVGELHLGTTKYCLCR